LFAVTIALLIWNAVLIRRILDVETHRHVLKVLNDMGAGRPVWVPKEKRLARNFKEKS
jgi:hypothetical protein